MDFSYFFGLFGQLAGGIKYTLGLFAITRLLSMPLGLFFLLYGPAAFVYCVEFLAYIFG